MAYCQRCRTPIYFNKRYNRWMHRGRGYRHQAIPHMTIPRDYYGMPYYGRYQRR